MLELVDNKIRHMELSLQKLAEATTFYLAATCYAYQLDYYGVFYELAGELKQAPVHHAVAPSLDYPHLLRRDHLVVRLENLGVWVWAVGQ